MQNFVKATWRAGQDGPRYYVVDIRDAPDCKIVAEVPTEGLQRMLVLVLNKNDHRGDR